MTMSGNALKRIEGSFSGLRLCKYRLIVCPTDHIIRFFVFERTPYKGLFYFWRVVLPLYTPYPFETLGCGERLARSDYIDLSEAELERSVARLTGIIAQRELDDLRSIFSPQDYLDRFGGPAADDGYTPRIGALYSAFAYYLTGRIQLCIDILDDFGGKDIRPHDADHHLSARALAKEMRRDPAAGGRRMRELEIATIKRFALAPTMVPGRLKECGLRMKGG